MNDVSFEMIQDELNRQTCDRDLLVNSDKLDGCLENIWQCCYYNDDNKKLADIVEEWIDDTLINYPECFV